MRYIIGFLLGVLVLGVSFGVLAQLPPGAVICAHIGNQVKYCPAGQACCNLAGKCCEPGSTCTKAGCVLRMNCSVCADNQQRDSESCMASGDLQGQSDCVNRVNAEFAQCEKTCRP